MATYTTKFPINGFSETLDSNEARAGKIFIYYPSHNKKTRNLNLAGSCREECLEDRVVNDVYNYMNSRDYQKKRKEQLKNALRGYKNLNGSLKGLLETLGFEISDDGKHYKRTYYGDHRYVATAAKTCSDGRAGMNLSSIIAKLMF